MIRLNNLNNQHENIKNEMVILEKEINKTINAINAREAALHISKLAGLLNIHLLEEDKFLYPGLMKCGDKELQDMANKYNNEMGYLASEYTKYKNNYNISSNINENVERFITETNKILEVLKLRIQKEENELYHLIKSRGI